MDKIESSMTANEKKALKLIDEASNMEAKALWVATVIRGTGMEPINNYVHHNVSADYDAATVMDKKNALMNPSTKAGTIRKL